MTAWARRRPGTALWLAVFLYAGLAAVVVQTVVLPRWAPAWHAGHGLLRDIDAVTYHALAVHWMRAIHADGWGAWSLRPRGHVPVGIASAVYAVTVAEPWALIPVNAALHATATLTLFRILRLFAPGRIALAGVLPLALFPSALMWYAQIGKDGLAMLGILLVALGWARITRAPREPEASLGRGLPLILAGTGFAWLARPYLLDVLAGVGVVLALLPTGVALGGLVRRTWSARAVGRAVVPAWVAVLMIWALAALAGGDGAGSIEPPSAMSSIEEARVRHGWVTNPWLPGVIDRRIGTLAQVRQRFLIVYKEAGSNVDSGVVLVDAGDVAAYLPRAIHLGLFAPFPPDWLKSGVTTGASVMRRVAGGEMLILYVALAALPWALWRWRERIELHVLVVYCLSIMFIYALAIPNLGALFRFRYPFACLLIGLAVATTFTLAPGRAPAKGKRSTHPSEVGSGRPGFA